MTSSAPKRAIASTGCARWPTCGSGHPAAPAPTWNGRSRWPGSCPIRKRWSAPATRWASSFEQGLPQQALEHHLLCQRAIHEGIVKDPTLRLTIYGNLANDYAALRDSRQAIAAYKEALALLEDTANLEHQAGVYWGLSLAYKDSGDPIRGRPCTPIRR